MYTQLDLQQIQRTLATVRNRIEERFPGSGLAKVAAELYGIGEDTRPILDRAARPNWPLRIAVGLAALAFAGLIGGLIWYSGALSLDVEGIGELLQALESAAQDLVFFAVALYFLVSIESRLKRRVALRELHRLRSIVHIVDMHQLTKDPEYLLNPHSRTPSSPEHRFDRLGLARYLDYCTELLSISSKLAATHVQYLNDPVVLSAVNDVETLASNLSSKIWQKIVILDTIMDQHPRGAEVMQQE